MLRPSSKIAKTVIARKVGGIVVITLPASLLAATGIKDRDTVLLQVLDGSNEILVTKLPTT